jgi:hypothetical protein
LDASCLQPPASHFSTELLALFDVWNKTICIHNSGRNAGEEHLFIMFVKVWQLTFHLPFTF